MKTLTTNHLQGTPMIRITTIPQSWRLKWPRYG
jgi:hypothetical protein